MSLSYVTTFTRYSLLLSKVKFSESNPTMQESNTNLLSAFLTLSILSVVAWGGVRVAPRYISCALNGEFSHNGTVCVYDSHRTTAQGLGSRVQEYRFLLRL